jgi:uncharacterized protein
MSRDFPDWINPLAAAQGRRQFAGTVPLRRLRRLAELTEHDAGEAAFEARFFLDEDRRPGIELNVAAELELMCQASLAPFRTTVRRHSRLGVIEDESEMALLPPDVDPVLTDNGRMALATLVEDELILALPPAPRNPDIDVVHFSTGNETEALEGDAPQRAGKPNPFAALKGKVGKTNDP